VVYLYMDRFSLWWARRHQGGNGDRVPAIPGPLQPVGD
jgi:hypothetical protein